MKVNMTPNPLDVVTIHASQGDTEARQWEFELHNNGELIDTSNLTEQLFFKAYKGGTEQILPENTSTPTTSPFLGDIRYPQGLLTYQEFTYRQSPTEEDGLAKVTDIKGNTLNWNQLANVGTLSATASYSGYLNIGTFSFVANHKYLIKYHQDNTMASNTRNTLQVRFATVGQTVTENATANAHLSQGDYSWLFNSTYTDTNTIVRFWVADNNVAVSYSSIMLIDLTQMGLDSITDPSDFTSLFPLSYYSYNQGSLLSFNGNGIKAVGKNLFNINDFVKGSLTISDGILSGTAGQFNGALNPRNNNGIPVTFWDNDVTISFDVWTDGNASTSGSGLIFVLGMSDGSIENATVFLNSQTTKTRTTYSYIASQQAKRIKSIGFSYASQGANVWHIENFQIEFSATETSYEPYTSSTLSLPISTYFPNGMDGVGSDYDELTNTKATTRMTRVDLGTLDWGVSNGTMYANLPDAYLPSSATTVANAICSKYITSNLNYVINKSQDKILALNNGQPRVNIYDSAYTDAAAFKTAMSGVYLVYPLATPIETSITTASLVTENAEIPLSNEDGTLIGKCTEQLSENPGFIDAKIKLSDGDGECYSNKLQLHVERSPQ